MSGNLPRWIERLLNVEPRGVGEGTAYALDWSWPWYTWFTILFVIGAVGFVGYIYAREGGTAGRLYRGLLAAIRCTLIVLVLLMIAEFVLSLYRTGLPYAVVLIDESASMRTTDAYDDELRSAFDARLESLELDEASRLNLAKVLLLEEDAQLLRELGQRYKLKVYFVGEDARAASGEESLGELVGDIRTARPLGSQSRLGRGIRRALNDLRGAPPAAIVYFTDGITTEGETIGEVALETARRRRVPLYLVGLGSQEPVKDLRLHDPLYDKVVFKDDIVSLEARLTGHGYSGEIVRLALKRGTETLAETRVKVGADGKPQNVRLPFRPDRVGEFEYTLEVEPQPDEVETGKTANNSLPVRISVRDDKIKVLFVQAYPNFEWRYLKVMLERDSTIEFTTVVQEADEDFVSTDKSAIRLFPVRQEELNEYHVLLFGDVNPTFLSSSVMESVHRFVADEGGGIAFISGPRYTPLAYRGTPLADLMPIDVQTAAVPVPPPGGTLDNPYVPEITRAGLDSPFMQLGDSLEETQRIWNEALPPLYWLLEARQLKAGARVLAEHPTRTGIDGSKLPVICTQYVGAGKVLFHATDETHRWRRLVGDVYFQRYWVQAIRYLARSRLLEDEQTATITPLRSKYTLGEPVELRVRFFDQRRASAVDEVKLGIESEEDPGRQRRITLQRDPGTPLVFEGSVDDLPPGRYIVRLITPQLEGDSPDVSFEVEAPPGEDQRLALNEKELREAAEVSGGHYFRFSEAGRLLGHLDEGEAIPTEPLPPLVLWNRWPWLALFLALIVTEWLLRKRKGML